MGSFFILLKSIRIALLDKSLSGLVCCLRTVIIKKRIEEQAEDVQSVPSGSNTFIILQISEIGLFHFEDGRILVCSYFLCSIFFVLFFQFSSNQFANTKKLCVFFRMQVYQGSIQWNILFYSEFFSKYFYFWMLSSTELIFSDCKSNFLLYFWVVTHQWWAHWSSF